MGQILHGSATTTASVRRAIQSSQASIRMLAKQYRINPKTVAKWKKRSTVHDAHMGPKQRHSTILTTEEETLIVAFWKLTLLPLDDCLYALQETIPHLTRSALHRCFQRYEINRLPQITEKVSKKKRFKSYPIGYFHIDIAEVQTEEGKLYLFVAIDRTSKFTFVEVHEQATRPIASEFLRHLLTAVPYKIHAILTDNGIQFANRPGDKYAFQLLFDRICLQNSIDHRLTKPKHPWTIGQVERMNRTLKDATVYRYYYDTHQQLRDHLATFLMAYNFAKRLKSLKGLTPYEYICHRWQQQPERFLFDPSHLTLGLYTIKYTPKGGTIRWSLVCEADTIVHTITDTGIGIAPEHQPHVFDRFYRADRARLRDVPGSGLGLSIVASILQVYGGVIDIQSAGINQGATVIIRWRFQRPAQDTDLNGVSPLADHRL